MWEAPQRAKHVWIPTADALHATAAADLALYEPLERAKDAKARCGIAGERHKVGSARCPRALSVAATVLYVPKLPRRQESPRKHT